jgi:hypothetical protein
MAIVYLPFVVLVGFIIASVVGVLAAFGLRRIERFNLTNMVAVTSVFLYLLFVGFHLWSLSNYDHLSSGGSLKVSEGVITLSGYLSSALINLVFALLGGLVGLIWYFILNRLSSVSDT